MAVKSDGTQAANIEASPITISSVTYILESMRFNQEAETTFLRDADGDHIGSLIATTQPKTGDATLQLAASNTAIPTIGDQFTLAGIRDDGVYVLTSVEEALTAGDYTRVNVGFYKNI